MGGVKSFEETGPFKCHLDMKRAAAAAANAELLMLPLGREREADRGYTDVELPQ